MLPWLLMAVALVLAVWAVWLQLRIHANQRQIDRNRATIARGKRIIARNNEVLRTRPLNGYEIAECDSIIAENAERQREIDALARLPWWKFPPILS